MEAAYEFLKGHTKYEMLKVRGFALGSMELNNKR